MLFRKRIVPLYNKYCEAEAVYSLGAFGDTPATKSLWTVLPAADSTITVRLFQQVAVRKPLYINQPNKYCFKWHILYY